MVVVDYCLSYCLLILASMCVIIRIVYRYHNINPFQHDYQLTGQSCVYYLVATWCMRWILPTGLILFTRLGEKKIFCEYFTKNYFVLSINESFSWCLTIRGHQIPIQIYNFQWEALKNSHQFNSVFISPHWALCPPSGPPCVCGGVLAGAVWVS